MSTVDLESDVLGRIVVASSYVSGQPNHNVGERFETILGFPAATDDEAVEIAVRERGPAVAEIGSPLENVELAALWMLESTPGGADQELSRSGHRSIESPIIPFDSDMSDPDLNATVFAPKAAGE